ELRHKRANGGEIVVTSVWALHRDKQGAPTAILEVNSDITERKRMEQELLQLAEIVEASDDAIIGEQLDGTILTWNRGAEKVYGYAAGEVIGRRLTLLAPTGREHEIPQIMERIRKGERIEQYQTKHRRKDGAVIDISLTVSPVKDDTGRITGAAVVARYVTEQRQAEERFRLMVEAAPSGMVVTNEAGQIILVNTQTERLFGYSREELIGESVELLVPRRFGAEHTPYLKGFYADASSRPMGEGQDLYARRKDGSEFPVEIGLNPIEASGGQWVLRAI